MREEGGGAGEKKGGLNVVNEGVKARRAEHESNSKDKQDDYKEPARERDRERERDRPREPGRPRERDREREERDRERDRERERERDREERGRDRRRADERRGSRSRDREGRGRDQQRNPSRGSRDRRREGEGLGSLERGRDGGGHKGRARAGGERLATGDSASFSPAPSSPQTLAVSTGASGKRIDPGKSSNEDEASMTSDEKEKDRERAAMLADSLASPKEGSDAPEPGVQRLKKLILEFVKTVAMESFRKGKIDNSQFKTITKKATHNILEGQRQADPKGLQSNDKKTFLTGIFAPIKSTCYLLLPAACCMHACMRALQVPVHLVIHMYREQLTG